MKMLWKIEEKLIIIKKNIEYNKQKDIIEILKNYY
jgi:hypothetical protein